MFDDWAELAARTGWTLGLQLTVSSAIAWLGLAVLRRETDRRSRTDRRRSAAILSSALPQTVAWVVALGTAGWLLSGELWPVEPRRALVPGALTLAGAWATGSAYRLLRAGGLEGAGARRPAARECRSAGKTLFGSVVVLLLLLLLSRAGAQRLGEGACIAQVAGLVALGAGGTIGLLSGLSGKPRPSGQVAAVLYVSGWVLLVRGISLGAGV